MIAIVDYGLGNLFSVKKAFEAVGTDVEITDDPARVRAAERIVLPGVGAFGDGMRLLRARGLDTALTSAVTSGVPFLGICLGLQLLAGVGEEHGEHLGLGWIPGRVRLLDVAATGLKIPHIGWNDVTYTTEDDPLFRGMKQGADFYFVHSYQLTCEDAEDVAATTQYGNTVTAAVRRRNIFATQFHPEKSQDHGLKLLENFIVWNP